MFSIICKQPSADIFNKTILVGIFLNFQKILAAHQKIIQKFLESLHKHTQKSPWESFAILAKSQAFTEAVTVSVQ